MLVPIESQQQTAACLYLTKPQYRQYHNIEKKWITETIVLYQANGGFMSFLKLVKQFVYVIYTV